MEHELHPQAGETVKVELKMHPQVRGKQEFRIEGWWDQLTDGSWMDAQGNPAAFVYAMRNAMAGLPVDDEVLYGHIGPFGHLVHVSEIVG